MAHVFLHGFAGRPDMWKPILEHMDSTRHCRVISLPGHGPTPHIPAGRFSDVVNTMAAELRPLAPVLLVGYSLGARLALSLTIGHPDLVAAATLISVNPGLPTADARAQRTRWDDEQAALIRQLGVLEFIDRWEQLPIFGTQHRLPAALWNTQREQREQHTVRGLAWVMETLGLGRMPPTLGALPACEVPLHLVCGVLDPAYVALAERVAKAAPTAAVTIVKDAGHNVVLEAPGALADILEPHD